MSERSFKRRQPEATFSFAQEEIKLNFDYLSINGWRITFKTPCTVGIVYN